MNNKIGVFDSGLGGLSILKEMKRIMPNENFLFYEDSFNNPYGSKSDLELLKICSKVVDFLLSNGCKIIVIACNTATTACITLLRKKYPRVIFVGTVPAIKVAYDLNCHNTLVLSTDFTMKSKRVNELLEEYCHENQNIINISGKNLAHLIELDNKIGINNLLVDLLVPYKNKVDSVILGCTHYSLIKEQIQEILPNALILDSCIGVSREVKHQLENNGLLNKSKKEGYIEIVNSKSEDLVRRSFTILQS